MKLHTSNLLPLFLLPFGAHSTTVPPMNIFTNPHEAATTNRIPTSYESAVMARRILHLTPLGTLSTIFPSPHSNAEVDAEEQRPSGLAGMPIGMMDYIADCETSGDPTILAIGIATSFKNVAAGSNISLALQWTPPYAPSSRIGAWGKSKEAVPYSAANLPRFSILGYLEKIEEDDAQAEGLASCFVDAHPDARYWLPGNRIHRSEWVRLVVQDIYWVGGFGDRAYIGWIPAEEWRNVTAEEWQDIRLPGEKKGWKEWATETLSQFEL
ncbi:hypothetical protein PVAG01_09046 [Phlyctema vagabunda]|uniref:CREG-like beta-barrel domain-containing protein n=1 Tax=Phlyctema vagabunda TaxID=108571 RepID=A0ABR4P6B0_9HELO